MVNRLAYNVWYPLLCSIIIVSPYLGSFLIAFTVPSSAAFTTLALSAFKSTPGWVIHSFKVSEYTKLSLAKSFITSVSSSGLTNSGSFSTFLSWDCVSLLDEFDVSFVVLLFLSTSVYSFSGCSFIVFSEISFFDSSIVLPTFELASAVLSNVLFSAFDKYSVPKIPEEFEFNLLE